VDGISLTVSALQGQGQFTISLIPHTLEKTILQTKRQGDTVNLETDVLGKYVEHILRLDAGEERQTPHGDTLTRDYLAENGFA
jgi:riboflavin synthase